MVGKCVLKHYLPNPLITRMQYFSVSKLLKTISNLGLQLLYNFLLSSCQLIVMLITPRYTLDTEENKRALKHLIFTLFDTNIFTSIFIQNKYAHLVNSIFLADFPLQKWNSFFNDFLTRCDGQVKCDIFLRILIQINLDIADREIPRTTKVSLL